MKVIGAGFGRTGTMSLKVALEQLGAGPCFHGLDSPMLNGSADRLRQQALSGEGASQLDWGQLLDGWGSTVGWLGARFYPEMMEAFPDSLVLLSVRDPEDWYASCSNTIHATNGKRNGSPLQPRDHAAARNGELDSVDGAIWDSIFKGRFADRDHAMGLFNAHNERVISTVPPDRLLVYEVEQGWGPLCEFLQVDSPPLPFPHINRAASHSSPPVAPPRQRQRQPGSRQGDSTIAPDPQQRTSPTPAATGPHIAGLALADPPTSFSQKEVLERLGLQGDEFAERIFARCGVQRRHLNLDDAFLGRTLQGRSPAIEEELIGRSIAAVERLGVEPRQIGTVVTATLYSLGCPTLAHRLVDHFQMDPTTDKYHLTGVGCAGAVPLMRLASQSLRQHPGKHALVVAAESMSGLLSRGKPGDPRAKTVGSAIFGDGCAAALLSDTAQAPGPMIVASQVRQIAGTLPAVSMAMAGEDSYLHLARELPDLAGANLGPPVEQFLLQNRLTRTSIDHWIVHPGGKRIIECVQQALQLSRQDVAVSWDLLAAHGNVGTPSIFYVLEQTIARHQPQPGERGLMVTIGPGVTLGLMLLQF